MEINQTGVVIRSGHEWEAARPGDVVRAVTDDRAAESVEGVLRLNLVERPRYVQVLVEVDGRWPAVRPSSVVVVRPGDGRPGDGQVPSLGAAKEAGLLSPEWSRPGGTWAEMEERMEDCIRPLVANGWEVFGRDRSVSPGHGDSVIVDLRRAGEEIEIERHDFGGVTGWSLAETDDDVSPPLWTHPTDDPLELEARFRTSGWI